MKACELFLASIYKARIQFFNSNAMALGIRCTSTVGGLPQAGPREGSRIRCGGIANFVSSGKWSLKFLRQIVVIICGNTDGKQCYTRIKYSIRRVPPLNVDSFFRMRSSQVPAVPRQALIDHRADLEPVRSASSPVMAQDMKQFVPSFGKCLHPWHVG